MITVVAMLNQPTHLIKRRWYRKQVIPRTAQDKSAHLRKLELKYCSEVSER